MDTRPRGDPQNYDIMLPAYRVFTGLEQSVVQCDQPVIPSNRYTSIPDPRKIVGLVFRAAPPPQQQVTRFYLTWRSNNQ